MVLGVQYLMRYSFLLKQYMENLVLFDTCGTNEYRLPKRMSALDFASDGFELPKFRGEDLIWHVRTLIVAMRRNADHFQFVDLVELFCFCSGRTRHS